MNRNAKLDHDRNQSAPINGSTKFVRDVWSIIELKFFHLFRGWYLHFIRPLVFPLAIFYWLRVVAPEDPEIVRRIMTGAIIFGFALSTANMLAQQLVLDRFSGRLRLIITMPVSKAAYALGLMLFTTILSTPMLVLLLLFASIADVEFQLGWTFFPLLIPILLTMGGLTFIVASWAPSQEAGSIMANLVGIVLVMVSPVFFNMEQASPAFRLIGWISPMRYAADGLMKSLSGDNNIWTEFIVLTIFACITLSIGLQKLRWRES